MEKKAYHSESTEVSNSRLGKSLESKIRPSNDHHQEDYDWHAEKC